MYDEFTQIIFLKPFSEGLTPIGALVNRPERTLGALVFFWISGSLITLFLNNLLVFTSNLNLNLKKRYLI